MRYLSYDFDSSSVTDQLGQIFGGASRLDRTAAGDLSPQAHNIQILSPWHICIRSRDINLCTPGMRCLSFSCRYLSPHFSWKDASHASCRGRCHG